MSRRHRAKVRDIIIEAKYNNLSLTKFINKVMKSGKKSLARKIVYSALDEAETKSNKSGIEIFNQAISNVAPSVILKSRRVGGANYQVPTELHSEKSQTLAMRWIIESARSRSGSAYYLRLARELLDASNSQGPAVKRKDDIHKMAEANKAFAHFRW
ncbi:MAG: 30S ribosomal protein S7 [Chloroflexi bacterium]|jgi:small subunit ribosomal protein S7|nr:30S ribosomal protein S7 [Chloroflexota bacterium]|tara:strand:- start:261 stop:731 length:471 start_codon:yes stop_codon:yes gene_type:complete